MDDDNPYKSPEYVDPPKPFNWRLVSVPCCFLFMVFNTIALYGNARGFILGDFWALASVCVNVLIIRWMWLILLGKETWWTSEVKKDE